MCLILYAFLESAVADRIGMAAWLLWSGVAMRVEWCRLVTWCCKMHCNGCMNVAWGLCWAGIRSTKPCTLPVKWLQPAMKGTSRGGHGCGRSGRNGFRSVFLQRVVGPVCIVLCVSWICGCRSQLNGCMIVVIWRCHVCREMQVCYMMLQNVLQWLHECFMGLVLGRKPEHKTMYFSVRVRLRSFRR